MEWYLRVLRQYATFSGRARRTEFWMYQLFNLLICAGVGILAGILFILKMRALSVLLLVALVLYALALIVPSLAVTVRRFHDSGKSGWLLLLAAVPVVGGLIVLIFECLDSQPGNNQYGPNPKGIPAPVF